MKTRQERTKFISFYVTEDEKETIVRAAIVNDQSISDFCRKSLMEKAEQESKKLKLK